MSGFRGEGREKFIEVEKVERKFLNFSIKGWKFLIKKLELENF